MSVTTLLATGYLPVETKNSVATETWDKGRNSCPTSQSNCLHKYSEMPQKYRYMGSNLKPDDKFASIIVGREPMCKLNTTKRQFIVKIKLDLFLLGRTRSTAALTERFITEKSRPPGLRRKRRTAPIIQLLRQRGKPVKIN